jgi:hypothetical protein
MAHQRPDAPPLSSCMDEEEKWWEGALAWVKKGEEGYLRSQIHASERRRPQISSVRGGELDADGGLDSRQSLLRVN